MTSSPSKVYVWTWPTGADDPVVAGVVTPTRDERRLLFTYARTYRERPNAVPLFTPELPLAPGTFDPALPGKLPDRSVNSAWLGSPTPRSRSPLEVHGCLRDSAPDAWGRRVINLRLAGDTDAVFDERAYWLHSSSDRIGALDFQESPTEYVPRGEAATLPELFDAARRITEGLPITEDLVAAAGHGTSIGGARPKALLRDNGRHLIAKFPSSADSRPVVQAEAVAMTLAHHVGVEIAPAEVVRVADKPVLLMERFDRPVGGGRKMMVSALTVLGLREEESRYGSYAALAEAMMHPGWHDGPAQMRELFTRAVLNVAVGNTDDHLRNHAAFFDGVGLRLTPAYDVAPQPRSTRTASHAISFGRSGEGSRMSRFGALVAASGRFRVQPGEARDLVDHVVATIKAHYRDACEQALLTRQETDMLWGREFLNPYCFYDED